MKRYEPEVYGLMEHVLSAGMWPATRQTDGMCPRCGSIHEETPLHKYWCCPDNVNAGSAVTKSDHLKARALVVVKT